MRNFQELDGESINLDSTEIPTMSSHDAIIDTDNFYAFQGDAIPMVAASAAQNTYDYFDKDNFYPMDGVMGVDEFSDASGIFQNIKDYFSKEERAERKAGRKERKAGRKERKAAKTDEIRSRAELNKSLAKDKPSDLALAQALQASSASPRTADKKMSGTTKTILIVGGVLAVGVIGFLVYKSMNKGK